MFSQSTAQRVLMKGRTSSGLVQQPKRFFQQYGAGPYKSGFERMVVDKFSWSGLSALSGMGFAVWGVLNVGIYGLSLVMSKDNFNYHFMYTGNGKFLQPLKAMMAANSINNVAWTAPSLILGGLYLQQKLGNLTAMKIFGLCLFASYAATTALGPATRTSSLNLRSMMPLRWDSIDSEKGHMVGADLMAGMCLYSCLFASGYWMPGVAFAAADLVYYGPMGVAMPAAAAVGALTFL